MKTWLCIGIAFGGINIAAAASQGDWSECAGWSTGVIMFIGKIVRGEV